MPTYKVVKKQPNSEMCLVCGVNNPYGLASRFYELDNHDLVGIFIPKEEHQSYPNRLHGGISSSIIDETICRAIMLGEDKGIWGVTLQLNIKYRLPVPLGEEIKVFGRIVHETARFYEGEGEIVLANGKVAVSGMGKYLKVSLKDIPNIDQLGWKVIPDQSDPANIDKPIL